MTQLIIISGASGSGKTTLSRALAPYLRAQVVNAGDVVLATMKEAGFEPRSRQEAGGLFLETLGEHALGPLLNFHIRCFPRVIVDGLRLPAAHEFLMARRADVFHLHLDVSAELRERRLVSRDGANGRGNAADDYTYDMRRRADLVITKGVRDWTADGICFTPHWPILLPVSAQRGCLL